eukprot:jgi/Picsp_1/5313/NSC_02674-R1_protein
MVTVSTWPSRGVATCRGKAHGRVAWNLGVSHVISYTRTNSIHSVEDSVCWKIKATTDKFAGTNLADGSSLLKDSTVVLHHGDSVAYVLGISHVSRKSCELIQEIIERVKPDAVMVELCHERTGLLVDDTAAQTGKNAWYSSNVDITGLPTGPGWPSKSELISILSSSKVEPISTRGIQQDADRLLATGLFESAVPITSPPPEVWDPMFVAVANGNDVLPAVQLQSIEFRVVAKKTADGKPGPGIEPVQMLRNSQAASNDSTPSIIPWASDYRSNQNSKKNGKESIVDSLASVVTSQYAGYQGAAGRKVGIAPGQAWRVALQASAKHRVPYFFLGDRPASVTGRRLAAGMVSSSVVKAAAALGVACASFFADQSIIPLWPGPVASLAISTAACAAAFWPLVSPILEIKSFSELTASQIEDKVKVTAPLQEDLSSPMYLWGEDALIKWPGAEGPIINDRDEYMAYATYSILANEPSGLTPAYLRKEISENAATYLYAMPAGGCNSVSPPGKGIGQFSLTSETESNKDTKEMMNARPINKVVAIVGTAHVRGMARHWKMLSQEGSNETSYLEKFCS